MAVRLTQKKRKQVLKDIDDIIMYHRIRMYQQLVPNLTQANVDEVRSLIGQMNDQLAGQIIPQLNDLIQQKDQQPNQKI